MDGSPIAMMSSTIIEDVNWYSIGLGCNYDKSAKETICKTFIDGNEEQDVTLPNDTATCLITDKSTNYFLIGGGYDSWRIQGAHMKGFIYNLIVFNYLVQTN